MKWIASSQCCVSYATLGGHELGLLIEGSADLAFGFGQLALYF